MQLNDQQIQIFQKEGYLAIPHQLVDKDHLQELRSAYDKVFEKRSQTNGQGWRNLSATDGKENYKQQEMLQIMEMWEKSEIFHQLLFHPPLLSIVACLIGPNIQLFHDQALYKPAQIGGPVPWHQDNGYWQCEPANLVSIWLALDDADTENGCMNVIPGSHLVEPSDHSRAKHSGQDLPALLSVDVNEDYGVSVPLKSGFGMVHHCLTLHQTNPNGSDRDRRAIVIHYMPVGTKNREGEILKHNLLLSGNNPYNL